LIEPARRRPTQRFVIGGAGYPSNLPWASNIWHIPHVPPADHPAFFGSSRLTLNVTRADMAATGFCPSGRLFEAAACGTPLLSDSWDGIDHFFRPGREIILAQTSEDALAALDMPDAKLASIARAARERVLSEHTSSHRAEELICLLSLGKHARADSPRNATPGQLVPARATSSRSS
jgi:spore maturation protein CgeB